MDDKEIVLYDGRNNPILMDYTKKKTSNKKPKEKKPKKKEIVASETVDEVDEPNPISQIKIIDLDLETIIEANDDNSITLSTSLVPGTGLTGLQDAMKNNTVNTFEINGENGFGGCSPEKDYTMQITFNAFSLENSLKQLIGFLDRFDPKEGFPPEGTKSIIENLSLNDISQGRDLTLISPSIVVFEDPDQGPSYFPKEGYPLRKSYLFTKIARKEAELLLNTKGKIKLFEKGIPTNYMEELYIEIESFLARGSAFYKNAEKIEKFFGLSQAQELYLKSYMDCERARIIQEWVLDKERPDDLRHEYIRRSRDNYVEIHLDLIDPMIKLASINSNYDYVKQYIDFIYTHFENMLKVMEDKYKGIMKELDQDELWGNSDISLDWKQDARSNGPEDVESGNIVEVCDSIGIGLKTLLGKKQDIEREEHMSLITQDNSFQSGPYRHFSPGKLLLDQRLRHYRKIGDKTKIQSVEETYQKRMIFDPLYFKSHMINILF
jgi:hypothetical protein